MAAAAAAATGDVQFRPQTIRERKIQSRNYSRSLSMSKSTAVLLRVSA
jgi:hypothetical protein